ncbi:MAG: DinB family protein, partial [Acidobacteriota bacterium]
MTSLVPELAKVRREIEDISAQASTLCGPLSKEELAWRPHTGRWSIAENLVHLQVTTDTFLPSVDRAIEAARKRRLYSQG